MNYLDEEEYFLEDARIVFKEYFLNIEKLVLKYKKIDSLEKKREFLRVVSLYNYLVKNINYSGSKRFDQVLEYASTTHKFITIIAIIESLDKTEKYIDLYEWLIKERKLPLTEDNAKEYYKEYKEKYGSRKSIIHFFASLDDEDKSYLQESITPLIKDARLISTNKNQASIEEISKLLYQIRSDFIHNATVVTDFSIDSTFVLRNKKHFLFEFPLHNFCMIFELGILKFFNIEPDKKPVFSFDYGFKHN